jgi:hypothetical protein
MNAQFPQNAGNFLPSRRTNTTTSRRCLAAMTDRQTVSRSNSLAGLQVRTADKMKSLPELSGKAAWAGFWAETAKCSGENIPEIQQIADTNGCYGGSYRVQSVGRVWRFVVGSGDTVLCCGSWGGGGAVRCVVGGKYSNTGQSKQQHSIVYSLLHVSATGNHHQTFQYMT